MIETREILPKRLREAHAGETGREFARRCGIKAQSLSRYERVGGQIPGAELLATFARKAGVSADWLLGLTDERTPRASAPAQSVQTSGDNSPAIAAGILPPDNPVMETLRRALAQNLPNPTEARLANLERGFAAVVEALAKLPATR